MDTTGDIRPLRTRATCASAMSAIGTDSAPSLSMPVRSGSSGGNMLRNFARTAAWLAAVLLVLGAAPASAQVVQGFQIGVGGFLPQGFDGRPPNDVLVTDLSAPQSQAL